MWDVSADEARDYISGSVRHVNGKSLFCTLIGFSCKTASTLMNVDRGDDTSIADEYGSTGETFAATRAIADKWQPLWLILENVPGLFRGDQHLEVVRKLGLVGYVVVWREQSPVDSCGWPHRRVRLWFLCCRADVLSRAGWCRSDLEFHADRIFAILVTSKRHTVTSLDDVLYPEWSESVTRTRMNVLESDPVGECEPMSGDASLGRKKNKELTDGVSSRWHPRLYPYFPTFIGGLAERERTLLDQAGVRFPLVDSDGYVHPLDTSNRVFSTSQSHCTIGEGCVPCICPSGNYWIESRGRTLEGGEMMRLQGVVLTPDEENEYSSAFLQNLAGNGFTTFCVSNASVTCLTLSGLMHRASLSRVMLVFLIASRDIHGPSVHLQVLSCDDASGSLLVFQHLLAHPVR